MDRDMADSADQEAAPAMTGFDDYASRDPWFSRMSSWSNQDLSRAAHRGFETGQGAYRVTAIEPRPWGHLEWSVGTITWVDAELITVHVASPYREPSLLLRARRARAEMLRQLNDPLSACDRIGPNERQKLHASAKQRNAASAHKANPGFGRMLSVVASMRDIEIATRRTSRGGQLASPAWFLLWNICHAGGDAFYTNTDLLIRAGYAAESDVASTDPLLENSQWSVDRAWHDRSWWRPNDARFSGSDAALAAMTERSLHGAERSAALRRRKSASGAVPHTRRRLLNPQNEPTATPVASAASANHRPGVDVATASKIHQEVRDAFTAFCFDPYSVLARPLLNDVSDQLTAAFYEAQEAADSAETELEARPDNAAARAYVVAVDNLGGAWDAADIHAREWGVSHLSSAEQNDVRRARRTLDLALNPNTPAGERESAYRTVLTLISGLVKVPAPAMDRMTAQIDAVRRKQLSAGV